MKDYSFHKKVIDDVIVKLNELDIDLYLIITAEGCDPMTSFIPGVDTVGAGASMFAKNGQKIATASKIDAQDTEESEVLEEEVREEIFDESAAVPAAEWEYDAEDAEAADAIVTEDFFEEPALFTEEEAEASEEIEENPEEEPEIYIEPDARGDEAPAPEYYEDISEDETSR
jgi:hypothetical protein